MRPVGWADLPDLQALKADPRAFAMMLGGVRTPQRTAAELADDIGSWGARGYGTWVVKHPPRGPTRGIVALNERADGRGVAVRFAFWPEAQGMGLAREAASRALQFGHDQAGLARIIAVARETNTASRFVLGGIGMREAGRFEQDGHTMVLFESFAAR